MRNPNFRSLLTILVPALLLTSLPSPAHAYLVPLLGGVWVLLGLLFTGLAIVGSFLFVHYMKLKEKIAKKPKDRTDSTPAQDNDERPSE